MVAELQTAGRGRRGRTWTSPLGANLTVSVAVRPRLDAADAWMLAAAAALAAHAACSAFARVELKWPNDVVSPDGTKLGGLLVETVVDDDRIADAVIGIGINVNWRRDEMPAELAATATSLSELTGDVVSREVLLAALLDALDAEVVALEAGTSPAARYRTACATLGTEVEVETGSSRVSGRAVDIDACGALVVETGDGTVHLATGEIARLRSAVQA